MKRCPRCGLTQPLENFTNNKARYDKKVSYCKPCAIERMREWRAANPERAKRLGRNTQLKAVYGLTLDEYEEMCTYREGRCDICKRVKKLHVDHDHGCCPGKSSCGHCIRGLLCGPCNRGIGLLGDSADVLVQATNYLLTTKTEVYS